MRLSHRRRRSIKQSFNLTATTTSPSQVITLTCLTVSQPTLISWGDGSSEMLSAGSTSAVTHTYATAGTYRINVNNARNITQIQLDSSTISRLNTAELRRSLITHFYVMYVANCIIDSSDMVNWIPTSWHVFYLSPTACKISSGDMVNWRPTDWWLTNMLSGTYNISSCHMANWRPSSWRLYSMPIGTYSISSADMIAWNPWQWYLGNIPSGAYAISSADMKSWRPTYFMLYSMPIGTYSISSADFSGWRPYDFIIKYMSYGTFDFASPCMRYFTSIRLIELISLNLSQSAVDAILFDIYAGRAGYTYATPSLNLGGTNADPSGVYQAMVPPTTGLEAKYDLVNDPASEGFRKWTITT